MNLSKNREIVRTKATRLIVSHEPTIVKAAELSKYAVERGSPAYLTCRAVYVPGEAEFAWFMQSDVHSKKASTLILFYNGHLYYGQF